MYLPGFRNISVEFMLMSAASILIPVSSRALVGEVDAEKDDMIDWTQVRAPSMASMKLP
jgi:hypothetical protein